ncbi:DNA polymerase III subunit delta' [Parvularcula sp. IMCC14364]|uniref:DNA polymerase III subunit delta' n=1 Tax=Parvularcula sp. IMCC14364 TaxID=3067902 RepID=UPI0027427D6C|nr:DNA polymerase III subunit delta' [Parvularcula sp. IMCC14364]
MTDTEPDIILLPEQRHSFVGHLKQERFLRRLLNANALSNGWMICGPSGIGKATLAYRLARAVLSGAEAFQDDETLAVDMSSKIVRLINQKAHPDLYIAERIWDEKKQRYATEISVETIRNLISDMGRTSANGKRVAIIDSADDLNRNAANALLKVLEEPPKGALVLLLVNAPGRLLPTIRSRCRVLSLQTLPEETVADFLETDAQLSSGDARHIAAISGGRPGYAIHLAKGEGLEAAALADEFLSVLVSSAGFNTLADKLSPKSADDLWRSFRMILLQKISQQARQNAVGEAANDIQAFASTSPATLVRIWEELKLLVEAGEALNTERGQLLLTMGIKSRAILREAA